MDRPIEYDPEWMETSFVSRVTLDGGQALLRGELTADASAARLFGALAAVGIRVDVITVGAGGRAIGFTLPEADRLRAVRILEALPVTLEHAPAAKLSLEGVGFGAQSDATATLLHAFANAGIEPRLISTSVRVIAVVIALERAEEAFALACRAFGFPDETDD